VQAGAGQVRNGGLEGVEAVVEGQQRVMAEGHDDGLILDRQDCRSAVLRVSTAVEDGGSLPPLGHRLRVDPVASGEPPQALLTMLYRSTDRRSRCGAPMLNLAHSASFHACGKTAPSNPGIKHLGDVLAVVQADLLADIEWKIRDAIAEWRFQPDTRFVVDTTPEEDDRLHLQNFAEDEMAMSAAGRFRR
jgi:hypothetical protein